MTSTNTPSGLVTSSGTVIEAGSTADWTSFDGNDSTFSEGATPPGYWLQYHFTSGTPVAISYRIVIFGTGRGWILAGSNDGSSFTTLDSKTSATSGTFTFSNTTAYTYYRLTATSSALTVYTLQIFGCP
jgi:hypothetical protein